MARSKLALIAALLVPALLSGQSATKQTPLKEPPLPVVDFNACPFEGCTFGKWIVTRDATIFSSWRDPRKPVARLRKGEIVTGLTGVHITYEPDRVRVLSAIPELGVRPGDTILRYMYRGEGNADIWSNGRWHRDYDCTFIAEKETGGCLRDCAAKVISNGRKDWWVQLRTPQGATGWIKVSNQFNCIDVLGGDPQCANL